MTSTNLLRRYWPAVAILAIVAVTAGVFVRGGRDEQLRSRVGQSYEAVYSITDDDDLSVDTGSLRVPSGELDIVTTAPQQSMPTGSTFDDRAAPEGGSLIGVRVQANPGRTLPLPKLDDYASPRVQVALEVGSRSYPVPRTVPSTTDATALDRSAWVAVAGEPKQVRIAVTYDGVTQRIDTSTGARESGAASPLYRLPLLTSLNRRQATPCGTPAISDRFRSRSFDDLRCSVYAIGPLPYLPGRGWAKPGTTWVSVLISMSEYIKFERDGRTYRVVNGSRGPEIAAAPSTTTTLTAVPPLRRGASLPAGAGGRLAVFALPIGTPPALTLTATFRDLITYLDEPARSVAQGPSVRLTWKVTP